MISESTWRSILTAPSSSQAVELAAIFSVSSLYQNRMPWRYEDLSSRSQENIRAVSRAFDVTIDGVPRDGWASWAQSADDTRLPYGWEDVTLATECDDLDDDRKEHQVGATPAPIVTLSVVAPNSEAASGAKKHTDHHEVAPATGIASTDAKDLQASSVQAPEEEPSAIEINCAEAVRNWAQHSPHTEPPSEAVATVRKSKVAAKLLKTIVSPGDLPTLRATVIGSFSEDISSTFAMQIAKGLIIPYISTLMTPASREMMQAIVTFCELHWRTAVSLYEVTDKNGQLNGAMSEVLVRVAAVLNTNAAMQCLQAFCGLRWGEDGVRVLESLVGKCKEEKDIAEVLVSSVERNILGLESSVRFGKLLFTLAKDVPSIAESYEQEMESIIGRSKVFLAKRALKILKGKKSKAHPG